MRDRFPDESQMCELKRVVGAWSERHGTQIFLLPALLITVADLLAFVHDESIDQALRRIGPLAESMIQEKDS